mmetsp:Transcript_45215/g.76159  ORF Transcript_45215/g.76159 Transcript_45215/m.76159 type:complete len:506 (+) Transcript_45215:522-2039(+)
MLQICRRLNERQLSLRFLELRVQIHRAAITILLQLGVQVSDVPLPALDCALLLNDETLTVPFTAQHRFTCEEFPDIRVLDAFTFPLPVGHDVEQCLQWRAGVLDGTILEIALGSLGMGLSQIVDSIHKCIHILQLRAQHIIGEDDARVGEELTHEIVGELGCDAVSQKVGGNLATLVFEILHRFQVALADEPLRISLVILEAAEDFGDDHSDVVPYIILGTNEPSSRSESSMSREQQTDKGIVQVRGSAESIEWTLGQGTLAPGPSSGRRLARQAASKIHEEFWQLLIVQWAVHRKHANTRHRGVVAPPGQHHVHRYHQLVSHGHTPVQSNGNCRQVGVHGGVDVRAQLQVSWVGGALTFTNFTRQRRAHQIGSIPSTLAKVFLHGLSVGLKRKGVLNLVINISLDQGVEIGAEETVARHIVLCLNVKASVDGVVWALEQPHFAVLQDLLGATIFLVPRKALGGHNRGRGDVILHLHLECRLEVLTQCERAPCAFRVKPHAEESG